MQDPLPTADVFLDAAGEACGTVTPVIKQALLPLEPGQVLEVLTHDPATRAGVPAWCRLTGHELVHAQAEGEAHTRFYIRKTVRHP
ncbi:MAG: sulfurtransferase TusA family protein [Solimonas sp.]